MEKSEGEGFVGWNPWAAAAKKRMDANDRSFMMKEGFQLWEDASHAMGTIG